MKFYYLKRNYSARCEKTCKTSYCNCLAVPQMSISKLETTVIECIEDGYMKGDLALICEPKAEKVLNSTGFLDELAQRMTKKLS